VARPRQSAELAQRLRSAGVPVTLIEVQGTEHSLDTPGEWPAADELTATVIHFFVARLK
jgi:acetyl esterase/lipase